jgi:hypothetical protein
MPQHRSRAAIPKMKSTIGDRMPLATRRSATCKGLWFKRSFARQSFTPSTQFLD